MPAYGPWIQEPDYEDTNRQRDTDSRQRIMSENAPYIDVQGSGSEMIVGTEWVLVSNGQAMVALNKAAIRAADREAPSGSVFKTTRIARTHYADVIGGSEWGSEASATVNLMPYFVFPGGFTFYPGDSDPEVGAWPTDAIGFEFEGDNPLGKAETLSLRLLSITQMVGENRDNSGPDGIARPLLEAPSTGIWIDRFDDVPDQQLIEFSPGNKGPATLPLGEDIELPLLPDGMIVYTKTSMFIPPQMEDSASLFTLPNSWIYGYYIARLDVGYTLRPPRYRWIFEDTSEPYRRIFPRDDALGAGSARNYPPPKARASSSRIGGGYL